MTGKTTGVSPAEVKKILEVLRIAHDEVTKLNADKPAASMLGATGSGTGLLSDMNHATTSLNLWMSYQAKSLVQFGHVLEDAMKAIQNSDDDSAASAAAIQHAVAGVTKQFGELTGKDTRVKGPLPTNMPGPIGALGGLIQTLESEAQFDAGVNK